MSNTGTGSPIGDRHGENWTHVWRWKVRRPDRKGQRCRVLARGALNSCLVEFEDGEKVITSRYAVRKRQQ